MFSIIALSRSLSDINLLSGNCDTNSLAICVFLCAIYHGFLASSIPASLANLLKYHVAGVVHSGVVHVGDTTGVTAGACHCCDCCWLNCFTAS